ncbi:MAG TPA: hypothetical protein VHV83_20950 [Armatimonadota bacterium]|nr:hypothetical protein [Armatimonadota bacterium]
MIALPVAVARVLFQLTVMVLASRVSVIPAGLLVNVTDAPNHGATVRTGTNVVFASTSACGTAPPQANTPASSSIPHPITRRIVFLLKL